MRAFYMIFYGCLGDLFTVYHKVNNIKVLRGNENLAVRRPRQLKANPLNNMLQVPVALDEMHFFHSKTLFNCRYNDAITKT